MPVSLPPPGTAPPLPGRALLRLPRMGPEGPHPGRGGYGEAAVGTGSFVYVVRCYSAASAVQFWRYDPSSDSWSSLSAAGLASGTFRNGTALAWDGGDCIYALAGARYEDPDRRLFLRYRISTDTWEQLENTPGPQGAGDALAWSGWDNRLYALLGSSQHGTVFARWSPSSGWEVLASPPGGVDDGASLAWAGGRHLFALRGEYYESSPLRDFWCYDIEAGSWSSRSPIPDPGGVGDGGSLLWIGGFRPEEADRLYALGGGSFDENGGYGFFRYRISADTWEELEDLPFPVGWYNGSRLAFAGDAVYCWQGTPSTWPGGGNAFYAWTVSAPVNNPPSLSSGSVSPSSGGPTTTFAYEVTYSDPDGDPPACVTVYIDGTPHAMTYVSGTYSGGALYRYQATLPAGSHTYFFEASDGTDTVRLPSSGTFSGPSVGLQPTSLSVSPSSFTLGPGQTQTLTATLTAGGTPLPGRTVSWSATAGSVSPSSGLTDSSGRVTAVYTAPDTPTTATITASFAGDAEYGSSYGLSSATVRFESTLVFTKPDGTPLAYTAIYYGTSEGQETALLGTTDGAGRITLTDPALRGATVYFRSGDGRYRGSSYIPSGGGTLSVQLTRAPGRGLLPLILILVVVGAAVAGAVAWRRGLLRRPAGARPPGKPKGPFCPHCKLRLPPDAQFCPECGKRVK